MMQIKRLQGKIFTFSAADWAILPVDFFSHESGNSVEQWRATGKADIRADNCLVEAYVSHCHLFNSCAIFLMELNGTDHTKQRRRPNREDNRPFVTPSAFFHFGDRLDELFLNHQAGLGVLNSLRESVHLRANENNVFLDCTSEEEARWRLNLRQVCVRFYIYCNCLSADSVEICV